MKTVDCSPSCDCHDEESLSEVGKNVWTNPKGSSGPSEKMKNLLARKKERDKNKSK